MHMYVHMKSHEYVNTCAMFFYWPLPYLFKIESLTELETHCFYFTIWLESSRDLPIFMSLCWSYVGF